MSTFGVYFSCVTNLAATQFWRYINRFLIFLPPYLFTSLSTSLRIGWPISFPGRMS